MSEEKVFTYSSRLDLWRHGPAALSVTHKRELLVTTIYMEHGMVGVGRHF